MDTRRQSGAAADRADACRTIAALLGPFETAAGTVLEPLIAFHDSTTWAGSAADRSRGRLDEVVGHLAALGRSTAELRASLISAAQRFDDDALQLAARALRLDEQATE